MAAVGLRSSRLITISFNIAQGQFHAVHFSFRNRPRRLETGRKAFVHLRLISGFVSKGDLNLSRSTDATPCPHNIIEGALMRGDPDCSYCRPALFPRRRLADISPVLIILSPITSNVRDLYIHPNGYGLCLLYCLTTANGDKPS